MVPVRTRASILQFGWRYPGGGTLSIEEVAEKVSCSPPSVYPAAEFPASAARSGIPMVIVNLGPTDHDHLATVNISLPAGEAVPTLVGRVERRGRWIEARSSLRRHRPNNWGGADRWVCIHFQNNRLSSRQPLKTGGNPNGY